MHSAQDVLEFWFGGPLLPGAGLEARLAERFRFWFGGEGAAPQAERDALIRSKLEPLLERAARGELAAWTSGPKRRLALILLFDQVPRNVYRGTAAAFAFDREALTLAYEGLQLAADAALEPIERLFFYLPLEHAESMDAQDASVAAFDRLVVEAPQELRAFCESSLRYARGHREIIAKFGRFPHRNRMLGRESTNEEREWLTRATGAFLG
jgi:uncharacterized protein (DUF924 family)